MNPIKLSKILADNFTDFEILNDGVGDCGHKFIVWCKDSPRDIVESLKLFPCTNYFIIEPNKFALIF